MKKFLSYFIFFIIQWTWGIILNIIGLFVAIGMICTRHRPYWCGPYIYFRTKWDFGGVEFGMFFIIGEQCDSIACHEMGHSIQNMIFGPICCFLSLGSMIRYWYREFKYHKKSLNPPTSYNSWWYEGVATKWGTKFFNNKWYKHCEMRNNGRL